MIPLNKSQDLNRTIKSPTILQIENLSPLFQPMNAFHIDPVGFIMKNVRGSVRSVLNCLINYSNIYKNVFVSQETIAKRTGYEIRTIKRALSKLDEYGLIRKHYRRNHTSVYELASWFTYVYNRRRLMHIFKGLRVNQPRRYYSGTYDQWKKLRKAEGVWMKEYTCKNVKFEKPIKKIKVSPIQLEPRVLKFPDQTEEIGEGVEKHRGDLFALSAFIYSIRKDL